MDKEFTPDYDHLKCDDCGGVIGFYDRKFIPTCEHCGRVFKLYELTYDQLKINDKTGWIFPVLSKRS